MSNLNENYYLTKNFENFAWKLPKFSNPFKSNPLKKSSNLFSGLSSGLFSGLFSGAKSIFSWGSYIIYGIVSFIFFIIMFFLFR